MGEHRTPDLRGPPPPGGGSRRGRPGIRRDGPRPACLLRARVAEPRLREALPLAQGTYAVRSAQALFALTRDQDLAQPICAVLSGDGHWSEKIHAAIALNAFAPKAPVVEALIQALEDGEYLVRRHSAQTLLTLAGRRTTIEGVPELWADIRASGAQKLSRALVTWEDR
jgi:HEAT repeat protein